MDCLPDIACVQPPSEKHRDGDGLTNLPAGLPVVEPSCAAKLLDREGRIPGIEEKGVDRGRHVLGLRHRVLTGDMDNLDQVNARQCCPQVLVCPVHEMITELECVDTAAALLRNDRRDLLLAGQEK